MADIVKIASMQEWAALLSQSTVVVVDFYADWCGPCKAIAPMYQTLATQLSRPGKITFAKVNVDEQQAIAREYSVTAMPTFMIFKNGRIKDTIKGTDLRKLDNAIKTITNEVAAADKQGGSASNNNDDGESSGQKFWLGAKLTSGYDDVTESAELKKLDLLNADSSFGDARTLLAPTKPSALSLLKGKGKAGEKDWVESDTDEQLMLFVPFNSSLKVHSLLLTSLPPKDDEDDELPMRPSTIQLYINRTHILGFDEAEGMTATQTISIDSKDWDPKTGTAKIDLRFVKFQNVSSLVIFVVEGDGDSEKIRLDRVRIIGETGEKREKGKLEKIGDEQGE